MINFAIFVIQSEESCVQLLATQGRFNRNSQKKG